MVTVPEAEKDDSEGEVYDPIVPPSNSPTSPCKITSFNNSQSLVSIEILLFLFLCIIFSIINILP